MARSLIIISKKWKSDLLITSIALIFMVFIAILVALQYYAKYAQTIEGFSFKVNLTYQLVVFGSFAFLVPRIFQTADQFPFQKHEIKTGLIWHFAFSLLFGVTHLFFCNLLLFLLDLSPSIVFPKFIFKYLTNIVHFYFLAYWAAVGIFYGLKYFKEEPTLNIKNTEDEKKDIIEVSTSFGKKMLPIQEVFYFEAYDHYVKVHTKTKFYLIRNSLKQLSKDLPSSFQRVHRSIIVNVQKIDSYQKTSSGGLRLLLINEKLIKVSQSFKKTLKENLNQS